MSDKIKMEIDLDHWMSKWKVTIYMTAEGDRILCQGIHLVDNEIRDKTMMVGCDTMEELPVALSKVGEFIVKKALFFFGIKKNEKSTDDKQAMHMAMNALAMPTDKRQELLVELENKDKVFKEKVSHHMKQIIAKANQGPEMEVIEVEEDDGDDPGPDKKEDE